MKNDPILNPLSRLLELVTEAIPLVTAVSEESRSLETRTADLQREHQELRDYLHDEQHFWDEVYVCRLRQGATLGEAGDAADEAIKRRSARSAFNPNPNPYHENIQ